jgi:hypothetical protein
MSSESAGAKSEPESRKRMTSVAAARRTIASGSFDAIALRSSWKAAASPSRNSRWVLLSAPSDREREILPVLAEGSRTPRSPSSST